MDQSEVFLFNTWCYLLPLFTFSSRFGLLNFYFKLFHMVDENLKQPQSYLQFQRNPVHPFFRNANKVPAKTVKNQGLERSSFNFNRADWSLIFLKPPLW